MGRRRRVRTEKSKPRHYERSEVPTPPMPEAADEGHVAAIRPTCTECNKIAGGWCRCACGVLFARCCDHGLITGARGARAEHQEDTCPKNSRDGERSS